jgi:hypothetical protein
MAKVGYLEGVDPLVLTRLALRGVGTLPVSNGFDNHGKFLNSISERDEVVLVVGHLHKLLGPRLQTIFLADILGACRQCNIPVLVLVPEAEQAIARQALVKAGEIVRLVDPPHLWDELARELALE